MSKPSLARGTRDFGPEKMANRTYLFNTIKTVFKKFGFQHIETPSIENLNVLMGKYGEEGDQLLFKILNSGDFAKDIDQTADYKKLTSKISEKGLRYDLTVPFARYVVMNRNDIVMPFKRYQIQPVWRADRPQKGRYREFYQCDADVVGTNSLICEAEIVLMIQEVFKTLGVRNIVIKLNNRKILSGISEVIGAEGKEVDLCVAIDKLDKIGKEAVEKELIERGFSNDSILKLQPLFDHKGDLSHKLVFLKSWLLASEIGSAGVNEIEQILKYLGHFETDLTSVDLDITLARGLSYYTGAIFEVKALDVQMGSICGGGRYDNLTGAFGAPGLSGVGISFGVDRIYDVCEELNLFPPHVAQSTKVLVTQFDDHTAAFSLKTLAILRQHGIESEIYPDLSKIKKQFEYADKKAIPYVLIIGSEEMETGLFSLKNMVSGEQQKLTLKEVLAQLG